MRDPQTGEMRFRNGSNMFWGYILAWGLFGMSALWLNKSILTDPDPMTGPEVAQYAAGMFFASVTALCVLGRPYLTLRDGGVTVRNPMRIYRFALSRVQSVENGFCGFPKLVVAGRTIRAMGMEQTGLDQISGGSDDMVVFQAELADASVNTGDAGAVVSLRWSLMDLGLALLLAAWAIYAASFFIL